MHERKEIKMRIYIMLQKKTRKQLNKPSLQEQGIDREIFQVSLYGSSQSLCACLILVFLTLSGFDTRLPIWEQRMFDA